jgi:hypothetical protein
MTKPVVQKDLEGNVLPKVNMEVKKVAVPFTFYSDKCNLTIRKSKLDKIITNREELLEMVQQKLRVNAEEKLARGEFDRQCQQFVEYIFEHQTEISREAKGALKAVLEGQGIEEVSA